MLTAMNYLFRRAMALCRRNCFYFLGCLGFLVLCYNWFVLSSLLLEHITGVKIVPVPSNVTDDEYHSVFDEDSGLSFKQRVLYLLSRTGLQKQDYLNVIDANHSSVQVPGYFVDNFLLEYAKQHDVATGMKTKIQALAKTRHEGLTTNDRQLPLIQKFDYTFTLGIYFNKLKRLGKAGHLTEVELPFHWYDFTDLGMINADIQFWFLFNFVLTNYQNIPQDFKDDLIRAYYRQDFQKNQIAEFFASLRANDPDLENLNDFEVFLSEINFQMNSCHIFQLDDGMSIDLLNIIEGFYQINFPTPGMDFSLVKYDIVKKLARGKIDGVPTDPAKIEAIVKQRNLFLQCLDYSSVPADFKVSYSDYVSNASKYQPAIGFNVIFGTRDKYHIVPRLLYGKSYLYNYNGLNDNDIRPLKLTILNLGVPYTIKFLKSSTLDSQRLLESQLVNEYLQDLLDSGKLDLEQLYSARANISLNYLEEYNAFARHGSDARADDMDENQINSLLEYPVAKSDVDLHYDAFVNVDAAQVISNFHKTVNESKYLQEKQLDTPADLIYEKIINENNFLSANLRKYYQSVQYSNKFTDINNVVKYFYEIRLLPERIGGSSPNTGHFDWRFFNDYNIPAVHIQSALSHTVSNWLQLTEHYKLKTWIAHGSLFSWYFDGKNFPWDLDMDVQMPVRDLHKLCLRFNQSLVMEDPSNGLGLYFLDCGSSMTHRSKENGKNNIDARFIDTKTGFYIDITGVSFSGSKTPEQYLSRINWDSGKFFDLVEEKKFYSDLRSTNTKKAGYLSLLEKPQFKNLQCNLKLKIVNCRNNHFARLDQILPLRKTLYEGQMAYIPNKYEELLNQEYEGKWVKPTYNGKLYIPQLGNWNYFSNIEYLLTNFYKSYGDDHNSTASRLAEIKLLVRRINKMGKDKTYPFDVKLPDRYPEDTSLTDAQAVVIMKENPDYLKEYLLSKDLLDYHYRELQKFKQGKSMSDFERDAVKYSRPDYTLNYVNK